MVRTHTVWGVHYVTVIHHFMNVQEQRQSIYNTELTESTLTSSVKLYESLREVCGQTTVSQNSQCIIRNRCSHRPQIWTSLRRVPHSGSQLPPLTASTSSSLAENSEKFLYIT